MRLGIFKIVNQLEAQIEEYFKLKKPELRIPVKEKETPYNSWLVESPEFANIDPSEGIPQYECRLFSTGGRLHDHKWVMI